MVFVCKLKTKKRNLHIISSSKDLLLQTFKNPDKSPVGMADESNGEPQAPKKPRGGATEYRRNGLLVTYYSQYCETLEESFRQRLL